MRVAAAVRSENLAVRAHRPGRALGRRAGSAGVAGAQDSAAPGIRD
jgi:hypothetical protein